MAASRSRALVLAVVLAASACREAERPPGDGDAKRGGYTVEWVGELRTVHREGDARPRINLRRIGSGSGTFAIGPLAGLRGEITVVDGEPYIARTDGGRERVLGGLDHAAPFLVYGRVREWRELPVPKEVRDLADLERWLADQAATVGLQEDAPFPFKIETARSAIDYHVISNTEPGFRVTRPHGELMRRFAIESEAVTILGVHSTAHAGVFTHHGDATHMHMVSNDGERSGHVDRLELGPDAIAFLPAP